MKCTCLAGSLPEGQVCTECPSFDPPDAFVPDRYRVSVVFEGIEQLDVSTYGDQHQQTMDGKSVIMHSLAVESSSRVIIADVLRAAGDAFESES